MILARRIKRRIHQHPYQEVTEITPFFTRFNESKLESTQIAVEFSEPFVKLPETDTPSENFATNPWKVPDEANRFYFLFKWPITFILWCTIPDPKRFKQLYLFTVINCFLWIIPLSFYTVFVSSNVGKRSDISEHSQANCFSSYKSIIFLKLQTV